MSDDTTGPAMPVEAVLEKCSECHVRELPEALFRLFAVGTVCRALL